MAKYRFKAVRPDGSLTEGLTEAENEQQVVRRLQEEGLLPLRTQPAGIFANERRLRRKGGSERQVLQLVSELGTLLEAGLPLDHALRLIAEIEEEKESAHLAESLYHQVEEGASLSRAMAKRGEPFTPLQVNMVRAGEAAGALAKALHGLAEHLERARALREEIRSALIYPTLLVVVAVASVSGLLLFVIPRFGQMFQEMGQPLPSATRLVLTAGELLRDWGWSIPLAAAVAALWWERRLADPTFRRRWHGRLLRWPLVGKLMSQLETARFARTLAMLLESGVPLPKSLALAAEAVGNEALRAAFEGTGTAVKEGRRLSQALAAVDAAPRLLVQLIRVGEESGSLASLLHKAADVFERETRESVSRMLSLLEPLLIVVLGLMVGGIIASILVAVLDANQLLM